MKRPLENRDGGIIAYRSFLDQWAASRRTTRTIKQSSEAPECIEWPPLPPETPVPYVSSYDETGAPFFRTGLRSWTDALENGEHVVSWERRPQKAIMKQADEKQIE